MSPTLFRLPQPKAMVDRMGFNNLGVDRLVRRVFRQKTYDAPVDNYYFFVFLDRDKAYRHHRALDVKGIFLMRKLLVVLMMALLVVGCTSRKDFYATGGSRADGSIDMAYDFKPFETPVVDYKQAESIANSKCAVWGYNRAEPFGGQTQNCQVRDGWGNCSAGQMIVKYQCIGNITPATQASTAGSASVPSGMLSPDQYKEARVKALMDQNLPYGEYMKQYRKIMAE